jgi:hypothetical protein
MVSLSQQFHGGRASHAGNDPTTARHQVPSPMKAMLNIVKWLAIIAGVITIPFLVKKHADDLEQRALDVRYDTADYISDTTL